MSRSARVRWRGGRPPHRCDSASRPAHEAHLERMRKIRMAWIRSYPILERSAQLRNEVECVAMLIAIALGTLRDQRIPAMLVGLRFALAARDLQLDHHIVGNESVQPDADLDRQPITERYVLGRRVDASQPDAVPGGTHSRLPGGELSRRSVV